MKKRICFKVDKLVRDKMPEIMRDSGVEISERVMEWDEYMQRLKDKLLEEAAEVYDASYAVDVTEELADLLEVMMTLAHVNKIEFQCVIQAAERKRAEKGGFYKRIYNAFVEMEHDHPSVEYYMARPAQYPRVKKPS